MSKCEQSDHGDSSHLAEPIHLFGYSVHPWTMSETVGVINDRLDRDIFTQHVVVNVAKLVNMRTDTTLASSVEACDIVNIDGQGVVLGARFLGYNVPERVAGIDLFLALLASAEKNGRSVYLLGAREEVIEKTATEMSAKYPDLKLAGWHHGYFWDDEQSVVEKIRESGADMLFVAITSPKKERFINRWREQLGVKFVMGVGGTFDVMAGVTRRAPVWMQNMGMEWLYRLLQEPGRMWKRYLVTNTIFAVLLIRCKFRQLAGMKT